MVHLPLVLHKTNLENQLFMYNKSDTVYATEKCIAHVKNTWEEEVEKDNCIIFTLFFNMAEPYFGVWLSHRMCKTNKPKPSDIC